MVSTVTAAETPRLSVPGNVRIYFCLAMIPDFKQNYTEAYNYSRYYHGTGAFHSVR